MTRSFLQFTALAASLAGAGVAAAQGGGGPMRPPPQAAFEACASLKAGDACAFSAEGGSLDGACRAGPDGGPLACAPSRPPPFGHQPPPAATQACASLRSGDACSFALDGRSLDGACRAGPEGGALACAPKGMPPHHGPPPQAISACASARAGEACAVTLHGRALEGVCRAGPDGASLACAPASMPPPGPPPAALEACRNRGEGERCAFSFEGGAVADGVCRAGPEGAQLACALDGPPASP